jgi:hypothetical protein
MVTVVAASEAGARVRAPPVTATSTTAFAERAALTLMAICAGADSSPLEVGRRGAVALPHPPQRGEVDDGGGHQDGEEALAVQARGGRKGPRNPAY